MSSRFLLTMTAFASVTSSVGAARAADEGCLGARATPSGEALPAPWRSALSDLLHSTTEPGHPWSCVGGIVEVDLTSGGAILRVTAEGEAPVSRQVATPQDVEPLGQALLAAALGAPDKPEPEPPAAPAESQSLMPAKTSAPPPPPPPQPSKASRSVLLGAGIDGRYLGTSNIAWLGPFASAGIALGRWLPSVSFRQQSALTARPTLYELSFALGAQYRFELSPLELRTGLALRGASVQRVLPDRQGDQNRLEGRVGASLALAVPVLRWANVVLGADTEIVGLSRKSAEPTLSGGEAPTPFPSYMLGGSLSFEVLL